MNNINNLNLPIYFGISELEVSGFVLRVLGNLTQNIESAIDKTLSDFEKKVLNKYINGKSYTEIAEDLDTPVKSIDNAIQRIRKKAIKGLKQE